MKLGIILIIFGFMLGVFPLFSFQDVVQLFDNIVIIFLGLAFIVFGIFSLYKSFRLNKIQRSGKIGRGVYISSDGSMKHNGEYICYIKFYFKDENGKERDYKTKLQYTEDEAKYFSLLKDFEIKYDNKYAVITERIDRQKILEMQNGKYDSFYTSQQELKEKQTNKIKEDDDYFVCSYCNNVQAKAGKCERCGAIIRKNKEK